jgi:hypothetical protein
MLTTAYPVELSGALDNLQFSGYVKRIGAIITFGRFVIKRLHQPLSDS